MTGEQVGMIQSVREIPGFLTLMAVFVMMVIREHRLSAISILFLGTGLALTGVFPTYAGLMVTTVVMSFGFHYYETTNQSLTLQYFDKHTSPLVFGRLRSIAAASNIGIGVFIFLISSFLRFKDIYLIIGGLVMAVGFWAFTQNPASKNIVPQHKKMIFRKKYWLFYFLTFMAGARRQIFMAFAVLLLVRRFDFSVQEVTILFVVNNGINYFLSPLVGRGIVRFGERKVLSLEYFSLFFVFLAYAAVDSKILVCFLKKNTSWTTFSLILPSPFELISRRSVTRRILLPAWRWGLPSIILQRCFYRRWEGSSGWLITGYLFWREQG